MKNRDLQSELHLQKLCPIFGGAVFYVKIFKRSKRNRLDNSVMENFFGLLKSVLVYLEKFASYEDFISKLKDYIDY